MVKLLQWMLVTSFYYLIVRVTICTYMVAIYTNNRMDIIFILLIIQTMDQHCLVINGYFQHSNLQLFHIIFAKYDAH